MKEDLLANVVKHAVLSPSYMKAAWARELDNLRAFGLTTDQMMMASLDPASNELDFLAGSYNYPIIPGPASRCVKTVSGHYAQPLHIRHAEHEPLPRQGNASRDECLIGCCHPSQAPHDCHTAHAGFARPLSFSAAFQSAGAVFFLPLTHWASTDYPLR